ncbi:MAG: hypothetical protein ABIK53_01860 [bacterium]
MNFKKGDVVENIEILKELYREEVGKLIKMDIYKIVKRLQVLQQKEYVLEHLDLLDKDLIKGLPSAICSKFADLKGKDQITKYIGFWDNLNLQKKSERLMDEEVDKLREEKREIGYEIEEKGNSEIRKYYYVFAKAKRIELILKKAGVFVELDENNNIKWICKKY